MWKVFLPHSVFLLQYFFKSYIILFQELYHLVVFHYVDTYVDSSLHVLSVICSSL